MSDLSAAIARLRRLHRMRCYAMEQRKRANLRLGSFLRLVLGWSRANTAAENARIEALAKALVAAGEADAKKRPAPIEPPEYGAWRNVILASIAARAPFNMIEKAATADMEALARTLPVWPWCEAVRGFGAASLGVIVAEAGDLSGYPAKGHLWKRMGLAVMGDVRQGGLKKTASKADWIAHGYNRQRRSRIWNIGKALIKGNRDGVYRQTYLARKLYERGRAEAAGLIVAPSAKIPKARAAEFMSIGHIDRRAQRYMEKRLLRDLWQAWRRDKPMVPERAILPLPVAAE